MLKLCREKNIHAVIHNAASHKSEEWYKEAFESNTDAEWWFGIDGLPNQSHVYRKNQDGVKLFNIMLESKKHLLKLRLEFLLRTRLISGILKVRSQKTTEPKS
jgi:hypothetical protein